MISEYFIFLFLSFEELEKVNFNKFNDVYLNIKLCKSNEHISTCDGIKSKICLVKYKSTKADIGSKIKGTYLNKFSVIEGNCCLLMEYNLL